MPTRSRFLPNRDPISKIEARFERWLHNIEYESCSENYPAAVLASALVDEYFEEYPEYEPHRAIVETHAKEIGWISDYQDDADDDE